MPALPKSALRLPAPLALMTVIFVLSAQSGLSTELGLIDLIGRKIAHAVTFGSLTALWWWALRPAAGRAAAGPPEGQETGAGRAALIAAAAISFLYAISDEYHQSFVTDRIGSPIDVGIDAAGIAIACRLIATGRLGRWAAAARRLPRPRRGGSSG